MTFEELQKLLSGDYAKAKEAVEKEKGDAKTDDYIKQYKVSEHAIMDPELRKDKPIKNQKDETIGTEKVARLAIPIQELIVTRAAMFLCANPIQLDATADEQLQRDFLSIISKTWKDNKLDFKNMDLAEKMMSETEVAELWFIEQLQPGDTYWDNTPNQGRKFRLRMMILANSLNDKLYPVKDPTGNLVAFGRGYTLKVNGQDEEHFDIYTDTTTYKGVKQGGTFNVTTETNLIGKIPVIYYSQPLPEWNNVQTFIERLETKLSNHSDTNDYFDSPILFIKGKIESLSKKGDSGKVVQSADGKATAEYLDWDQSVASTKLELENLWKVIHTCTQTPDISFEQMKSLGTFSGVALKLLFMDAHGKAAKKAGVFGEGIQRRINYIKAALAYINVKFKKATALSVEPKFEFYLPKNETEEVDTLTTAVTGGIMSVESAVRQNPKVHNADAELELIKGEQKTPAEKVEEVMEED